ncbi:MAG: tetratricopeptide repeat protein [Terracidiphilus sp.]
MILATARFSAMGQVPTDSNSHLSTVEAAARDELNKGVEAFKSAHYDEAINHFQRATDLAPNLPFAKLYLATALSQNVVPGLQSSENLENAQRAINIFQEVLDKEPHNVNTMKQIAGVDYSINKLDDAKVWQKKVLDEDPKDPEAAYTIGVIDWQEAHQNALKAFSPVGITDDGEGNAGAPVRVMEVIKTENGPLVEEALLYLNQAVENHPNYADAMAYLNLVYRRKADLDVGNEAARLADVAKANEWRRKAMETRKANEEKRNAGVDLAR